MRKVAVLGMLLALCVMAVGCAVQNTGGASPQTQVRDAKWWATYWMGEYAREYMLYLAEMDKPEMMTATRATILRTKKQAFAVTWEPLLLFSATVDNGGVPPPDLWARVTRGIIAVSKACGVEIEIPETK